MYKTVDTERNIKIHSPMRKAETNPLNQSKLQAKVLRWSETREKPVWTIPLLIVVLLLISWQGGMAIFI